MPSDIFAENSKHKKSAPLKDNLERRGEIFKRQLNFEKLFVFELVRYNRLHSTFRSDNVLPQRVLYEIFSVFGRTFPETPAENLRIIARS